MSFVVSLDGGAASTKSTPAVASANSSAPAAVATSTPSTSPIKSPKAAASPADVATVSKAPAPASTVAIVETIVPVVVQSTEQPRASSPAAQSPPGSSTIIPSISIAPVPKPTSAVPVRPSSSISIIIQPSQSSQRSEPSEVESPTSIVPIVLVTSSKSKSSSASTTPITGANGSPFGSPKGSQSESSNGGKKSGSKVAGVVGGLSAAVLICIIVFFIWKWKTRGQYRFNKRTSFGPYGNGIDANRGGLLVSSVPPKTGDSMSTTEDYEKDEPNKYRSPSIDIHHREPTLPIVGGSPDRPFQISPLSSRKVSFDVEEPGNMYRQEPGNPYRQDLGNPYRLDPTLNGTSPNGMNSISPIGMNSISPIGMNSISPIGMNSISPIARSATRPPGVLYERRRLPPPPSMRRPVPSHQRSSSSDSSEGQPSANQPGFGPPSSSSPIGGMANDSMMGGVYGGASAWPNSIQQDLAGQLPPRSYTLANPFPRPQPIAGSMSTNPKRRVRRSMSLGGLHNPYRNPFLDPLSMHPVIPEVPSGQSTPLTEDAPKDLHQLPPPTSHPTSLVPGLGLGRASSVRDRPSSDLWKQPQPPVELLKRPPVELWNRPDSTNRVLMVRNPSPPPLPPAPVPMPMPVPQEERSQKPLNSMMSRMGSLRDHQGFKVRDAGKNF